MFTATNEKNLKDTANDVKNDISTGANRMGNAIRNTASNLRDDLRRGAHDGAVSMEDAAEQIGRSFNSATHEITDAAGRVKNRIERNPLQSTLIALGAGFVIGLLARR